MYCTYVELCKCIYLQFFGILFDVFPVSIFKIQKPYPLLLVRPGLLEFEIAD